MAALASKRGAHIWLMKYYSYYFKRKKCTIFSPPFMRISDIFLAFLYHVTRFSWLPLASGGESTSDRGACLRRNAYLAQQPLSALVLLRPSPDALAAGEMMTPRQRRLSNYRQISTVSTGLQPIVLSEAGQGIGGRPLVRRPARAIMHNEQAPKSKHDRSVADLGVPA